MRARLPPSPKENDLCLKCGDALQRFAGSPRTTDYCNKPACRAFASELSRARWEGHLLRNNRG